MIKLLVYIAFLLIIVAIRYLIRIYMLSKSIKANKPANVIEKEQGRVSRIFLILLVMYMIAIIWSYYKYR